jgi:hypothetical protein
LAEQRLKLPNPHNAVIDDAKLRDYLVSRTHPVGRFKAAFFGVLGYTQENWQQLAEDLRRQHLPHDAELGERVRYGQKYRILAEMRGPSGRTANVESIWIVLENEAFPRFVTAYPGAP